MEVEEAMSAIREEVYMEEGVVRLEPRVARIETDVASLNEKVERLGSQINSLDKRMAVMERDSGNMKDNLAKLDVDLRDLRTSLDTKLIWMVSTMITFGIGLLATMAAGFHWI